jgi:hypothetical protein
VDIHIFWEGPFTLGAIKQKTDVDKDYGIYQIYGHHPLYGNGSLLYIGQAKDRPFGKRIPEENWDDRPDSENTQVYIGRLAGKNKITGEEWGELIDQAEKLLIFAHKPALNTQNTRSLPEELVLGSRVYNWGFHRDLFPEVSGNRFTDRFNHITEDHIYTLE